MKPRKAPVFPASLLVALASALWPASSRAHGEYHDVVRRLQPQIARQPENAELRVRLIAAHVDHDEARLALEEIERVEALAPGQYELGYFRGRSLAVSGQWAEALPPLDGFLAKQPDHEEALAWRARVRARLGDEDGAVDDFRGACSATTDPELIVEFATFLAERHQAPGAVEALQAGLVRMPDDPALLECLVRCAEQADRAETALGAIDSLVRTWPRPESWMQRRAGYLTRLGRGEEARAAWAGLRDHILALPNLERAQPFLANLLDEARQALGETAIPPVVAAPAEAP